MNLTDTQQVTVSVTAVDKKGNKADLQNVVYESSDTSVATVQSDPSDPNGAVILAGVPGVALITVTADADLTEGTSNLTGTLDILVTGGQASQLTVNAGTPTEQP